MQYMSYFYLLLDRDSWSSRCPALRPLRTIITLGCLT
jgi:hypothetical protein